jgi:chemotaxis protein CheX
MALDLLTVDDPAILKSLQCKTGGLIFSDIDKPIMDGLPFTPNQRSISSRVCDKRRGADRMTKEQVADAVKRAATEVLSTMLSMDAQAKDVYTENLALGDAEGVVSFIGLTGEYAGTGGLQCKSDTARHMASKFLMSEFAAVNEEVLDAFGEFTNMIIGNFKNEMESIAGPMGMSIPTVIYGRNFTTRSLGHEEWVVVPFDCDGHQLDVKVCLKEQKPAADGTRQAAKPHFIVG